MNIGRKLCVNVIDVKIMFVELVVVVELLYRVLYGFYVFFVIEVLKLKFIIIYIFFIRDVILIIRGFCFGRNNFRNKFLYKISCVYNYIICYMLLWRCWRIEKLDDLDICIIYIICIFIWMFCFCLYKNLYFYFNSKLGFFYFFWFFELREIGGFFFCFLCVLGLSSFSSIFILNFVVSLFFYY